MELSPQQQDAVNYSGSPALVVAGAGSGKTRTLTAKIAHLIQNGFEPERILAITFTNKAADEMKDRLVKITSLSANRFPWVRTYHSACFKILKEHCRRLDFSPPVQIYATYQQQKILHEIIVGKMKFEKKYVSSVMSAISNAKNSGNPSRYFDDNPRCSRILLNDVYTLYEKALKQKNAVDFDNILILARNLLRDHEDIRNSYRDWFQFILCDEYQDTNNLNEEITRLLLSNGNLFAVGDDWQSIYSFRMSNVDHFLTFKDKYENARIFRLEENYRSANEIVRLANGLIVKNRRKMEKNCYSKIRGGIVEFHDFYDDNEEADWIARKMLSLKETGVAFSGMAVLYRTRFCSLAFEKTFRKYNIPYRMMGGKGFFERREIMDINCYLTAAFFDKDDTSFERIINIPKRGIGPGTVKKINAMRTGDMSLKDAAKKALREKLFGPKLYNSLNDLLTLLDMIKTMKPDQAVQEVINRTNYMEYVKSYAIGEKDQIAREENIEQLVFSAAQKKTLIEYIEEAALIRDDRADEDETPAGVSLSTIHASKGLEYAVVFVVACEEGLFPHWRSSEKPSELEEERRLMYVSMTRSERFLYLSCASFRKGQFNRKSRFLKEIEREQAGSETGV